MNTKKYLTASSLALPPLTGEAVIPNIRGLEDKFLLK